MKRRRRNLAEGASNLATPSRSPNWAAPSRFHTADQGGVAHDRLGKSPDGAPNPRTIATMIFAQQRLDHDDNGRTMAARGAGSNGVGAAVPPISRWQSKLSLFGDELRRLRRRSGLSQENLASRAGLSPEAVSLLERGRRSPRMTTMRMLADALRLRSSTGSKSPFAAAQTSEPERAGATDLRRRVRGSRSGARRSDPTHPSTGFAPDHDGRAGWCGEDQDRGGVRVAAGGRLSGWSALDAGRAVGRCGRGVAGTGRSPWCTGFSAAHRRRDR